VAPEASPFGSGGSGPRRWISAKGAAFSCPESIAVWKRAHARTASPAATAAHTADRAQWRRGERTSIARAEEACAGYGTAGDHWGVAASSLVRAQGAVHAGEVSTVATMMAEILRHSEAVRYDVFVVSAMLLEAWVAELRNEPGAAEDAYRRAPSSSRGASAL
jgi:hypothetical protein